MPPALRQRLSWKGKGGLLAPFALPVDRKFACVSGLVTLALHGLDCGPDTTSPRIGEGLKGQTVQQTPLACGLGESSLGRAGTRPVSTFSANPSDLSTASPPIPDGRHYSACVGVAEGVGLQELVTPPAVAIGPNGESLHTAQRATRVKPARIRDPGAVAVGEGNYTGTTLKTPRERPAGQAQPPQQVE